MSDQATTWVWEQDGLNQGQMLLALAIGNHSDVHGISFPGHKVLAGLCGCDASTVTRNLTKLEDAGVVARFFRCRLNGSRTSDWLVLAPGAEDRGAMVDAPTDGTFPDEVAAKARVSEPTLQVVDEPESGADSEGDHLANCGGPEEQQRLKATSTATTKRKDVPNGTSKEKFDPAREVWNEYVRVMKPRSGGLDEERRRLIRDALRVATIEECKQAIRGCAASPFHMGANDKRRNYNQISLILKARSGRTTRERIDMFIELADDAARGTLPSEDDARVAQRKRDVLDAFEFPHDDHAVARGNEAKAWLEQNGWKVETADTGRPTFRIDR